MTRSRAALLPHPADPFMFNYWLKFFNKVWRDEVDCLYIYINSPIEPKIIGYMLDLVRSDPKINVTYFPQQIEHGEAINRMLDLVQEDNVMLIEDDGFIFRSGWVDRFFNYLENDIYDLIGSPRGSCSQEIWDASKAKYSLDYSGMGDVGPNFWPCYLFTRKRLLTDTDRNFGAKHWPAGTRIEELDYTVKEDGCYGDTFVNTSVQLRNRLSKNRIFTIPQYHGSPDDLEHFSKNYNLWDRVAYWTHVGSLSSGTHGILIDDQGRSLARRTIDPPKDTARIPATCNTLQEHNEWERRVQWWLTFLEYFKEQQPKVPQAVYDFAVEYEKAISRIITQLQLNKDHIVKRQQIYKQIGL